MWYSNNSSFQDYGDKSLGRDPQNYKIKGWIPVVWTAKLLGFGLFKNVFYVSNKEKYIKQSMDSNPWFSVTLAFMLLGPVLTKNDLVINYLCIMLIKPKIFWVSKAYSTKKIVKLFAKYEWKAVQMAGCILHKFFIALYE